MTTVTVRRPARRPAPALPSGELVLEAPPEIPPPAEKQWTQALAVLPVVVILAAVLLMSSDSMSGSGRLVIYAVLGAGVLIVVLVSVLRGGGPSNATMGYARRLYLRRLAQHRARMRRDIERQRAATAFLHPEPAMLWALAAGPRLWERRADDEDFAVVRVGAGPQEPSTVLVPPSTKPLEQLEPLSALALRRFLRAYASVPRLPLAMPLTGFARVYLRGDRERAAGLARAMLAQLVAVHAPDDVRVAVCAPDERMPAWEWVKWLPHAGHPVLTDATGPVRLVAPAVSFVEEMVSGLRATRTRLLVVVLDGGGEHLTLGLDGVVLLDLGHAPPRILDRDAVTLEVSSTGELAVHTVDGRAVIGEADALTVTAAEALARQLTPMRLHGGDADGEAGGGPGLTADLGLADLLDLGDPYRLDTGLSWRTRTARDRLRVRFAVTADGAPLDLDLKESAEDGMGPHGLLIGATGSGKSELLRTLVLALATTHSPGTLNFALIDFKGGATFAQLDALPHTSAVITNLQDALPLVDRMADALTGELIRRQELLKAAGNFSSFREYDRARAAGAPLPEVPTLLVICDEFSELLARKQDFIDMFLTIGRLGRSLGVHLLLASQRLDESRLRGLDGHLSYRIALRTFSGQESRSVIGVPDAFALPSAPGHGYFQYGTDPLIRFRAAYVSGAYRQPGSAVAEPVVGSGSEILDWTTAYLAPPSTPEAVAPEPGPDTGDSLLDILVGRLTGRGVPAHQVWLPALDEPPALSELITDRPAGLLRAPIAIVDRPLDQRRDALELDLSAAAGHVIITGGPRSGKSTAVRTLLAALSLTHSPREMQFYCLDFGGGGLTAIRDLPHVGGVAPRQNTGAVRRTVAQITGLLAERERAFAEHELDGIAAYREARARGGFPDDPYGDVFLVVDGWQTLRTEYEDLESRIADVAARGLAYGLHLVVTCARSFDLRPAMRDLFGTKVELRLGDPVDTAIDRAAAQRVPLQAPGRGVAPSKHQMHLALPRFDGIRGEAGLREATANLVRRVTGRWEDQRAPRVLLLPASVPHTALPAADDGLAVPIGIAEETLGPVTVDLGTDPHLLLLGDARSGKTGFLRLLAHRVVAGRTPAQARIVLVDHRRSLLGEVPGTHLLGHGTDSVATRGLITELAQGMRERAPGPDITPDQLRRRAWWQGPEVFVLIDDYDLVVSSLDNPLQPLLEFLPQGRELGLHVVVTRRSGGAGRALFEPFLARLRDIGSPGVMLSGDRGEGPLLGGLKPEPLPPGRGRLITRGDPPTMMQLAWLPPSS